MLIALCVTQGLTKDTLTLFFLTMIKKKCQVRDLLMRITMVYVLLPFPPAYTQREACPPKTCLQKMSSEGERCNSLICSALRLGISKVRASRTHTWDPVLQLLLTEQHRGHLAGTGDTANHMGMLYHRKHRLRGSFRASSVSHGNGTGSWRCELTEKGSLGKHLLLKPWLVYSFLQTDLMFSEADSRFDWPHPFLDTWF